MCDRFSWVGLARDWLRTVALGQEPIAGSRVDEVWGGAKNGALGSYAEDSWHWRCHWLRECVDME